MTASRRRLFQVPRNAELFLTILQEQRTKANIRLHGYVIMPDHVHLLLTPAPNISLEKTLQLIKGNFSFRLKSGTDVWERSFDSRRITSAEDYRTCYTYIVQNPVRANLATTAEQYQYSSANPALQSDPAPQNLSA